MASFPKPHTFRCARLRELINTLGARRELACMDCGANDGTVVAAHSNYGKGGAIKASDSSLCALCFTCHSRLDQPGLDARPKAERREYEARMNLATLRHLLERGFLIVTFKPTEA